MLARNLNSRLACELPEFSPDTSLTLALKCSEEEDVWSLLFTIAQSLARVDALLANRTTLKLSEGTTYFQEGVDGCVCRLPMRGGGLVSVQFKG